MVEAGFVNDHRMRSTRYELLCQLAANGLIQMGPTGSWEVTRQGRDLIDRLDLLDELDGRDSGPGRGSSPWREVPPTQEPEPIPSSKEREPGDDGQSARSRRSKGTPSEIKQSTTKVVKQRGTA